MLSGFQESIENEMTAGFGKFGGECCDDEIDRLSEKVAFGTLTSLFLTDKPAAVIDEVYGFCESIGLPTTLEQIGLSDASDDLLTTIAETACAEGETIHNEAMPVTPEMVVSAMKSADMRGRGKDKSLRSV